MPPEPPRSHVLTHMDINTITLTLTNTYSAPPLSHFLGEGLHVTIEQKISHIAIELKNLYKGFFCIT